MVSADTNIVLIRDRNKSEGVMYITGRDIQDQELAMKFSDCIWEVTGEASQVFATRAQSEILLLLHEVGEPMTPTEIGRETGRRTGGLSKTLRKMVSDNLIENIGKGRYIPKESKKVNNKLAGAPNRKTSEGEK